MTGRLSVLQSSDSYEARVCVRSVDRSILKIRIQNLDVVHVGWEVAAHLHDVWGVIGCNEDVEFGDVVIKAIELRFELRQSA